MRLLTVLIAICLLKTSQGYLCYECNSTEQEDCYEMSPKRSYKAAYCDENHNGRDNCYAIHISERKQRRMHRGCKKVGICEEYENMERSNIHFKVLSCEECNEHYCNSIERAYHWMKTLLFTILSVSVTALFH